MAVQILVWNFQSFKVCKSVRMTLWLQRYEKSLNNRTFIRKSLVNCKIYLIFASVNSDKLKIKIKIIYKYHFAEY